MILDLSRSHIFSNGIYDFMAGVETIKSGDSEVAIELDYAWDYKSDPVITPTIIHEWRNLDRLFSNQVVCNAKSVLSIGGGGSSRTNEYLSPEAQQLIILNTGKWDLENAQLPAEHIETLLVLATGEDMPILDGTLDAIEIPSTLDHVVDASKVIEECFRVLRGEGMIGITLGNSQSWYRELVHCLKIRVTDNHEHHHNFHFTVSDVESLLADAGFINIKTIGTAYLKLPKSLERKFQLPVLLSIHGFISNTVLRRVLGDRRGGMFLTYANRPKSI